MKRIIVIAALVAAIGALGADKEKKFTLEQRVAYLEGQMAAAHHAFDTAEDQIQQIQDQLASQHVVLNRR